MQLAAVREAGANTNRQAIQVKRGGSYIVMGLLSHGNMSGITRKTHELPQLCRYLNMFGCFQLHGTHATWTSFTINVNQAVRVHLDPHNDPNSYNYTCSFGPFQGGELWTERAESGDLTRPVLICVTRNGNQPRWLLAVSEVGRFSCQKVKPRRFAMSVRQECTDATECLYMMFWFVHLLQRGQGKRHSISF